MLMVCCGSHTVLPASVFKSRKQATTRGGCQPQASRAVAGNVFSYPFSSCLRSDALVSQLLENMVEQDLNIVTEKKKSKHKNGRSSQ